MVSTEEVTSDDRVSTLRGAGVQTIDRRRMLWLGLVTLIVGLVAVSVVLFVAGAKKNAQIDDLKHNGVPVEVTITGCQGLLGGSGSNAAGYDCRGTFTLNGQHVDAAIPGSSLLSPGTRSKRWQRREIRASSQRRRSCPANTPPTASTSYRRCSPLSP